MDTSASIFIPNELLAPAAFKTYEGTFDPGVIKAGPDLYTTTEPLAWHVEVTNTGDALLVMGTVDSSLRTSCARCLEPAECTLVSEIDGYYLLEQDANADELEGDEFDYLPESREIDLAPLIIAGILLELPVVPLCKDDCKGLCPNCGENLNNGPCSCSGDPALKEFEEQVNPFAALKGYSFDE